MLNFTQTLSIACIAFACWTSTTFAAEQNENRANAQVAAPASVINKREIKENAVEQNPFAITFYKQNYIMPLYYTGSPDNKAYTTAIPANQTINNLEVKYQLSLKVPIWKNVFSSQSSFYFGYTQLSYWQAYNRNAFFRETDFQPEVFLANIVSWHLTRSWEVNAFNIGAVHESNGFGNEMERSWNRVYVEAIASNNHLMLSVKPWYVFHDSTYNKFNPNMSDYLGYGEIGLAYKFANQVLSLQTHSLFEQGGRRATGTATYSFPLTKYLNGYVQAFSGYGQSLIEYNHRTNSVGVGIALNNLI
jgi:phospholipase A1